MNPVNNWRSALLAGTVAVLVRAAFAVMTPVAVSPDGLDYDGYARSLATTSSMSYGDGTLSAERAPGYPFFLSLAYRVAGPVSAHAAAAAAQLLLDTVTTVMVLLLASSWAGPGAGLMAGLIYALYPPSIAYTRQVLSEPLFTVLFTASLLLAARSARGARWGVWIASALMLAAATLVRGTTLFFGPLVAVLAALAWKAPWRGLVFAAVFVMALIPWAVRNRAVLGTAVPVCTVGAGLGIYVSGFEVAGHGDYLAALDSGRAKRSHYVNDPLGYERALSSEGKEMIRQHPLRFAVRALRQIPRFWITSHSALFGIDRPLSEYRARAAWTPIALRIALMLLQFGLLLAAAAGMFLLIKGGTDLWLPAAALLYFTAHAAFDPCPRYHIPVMPLVAALAGAACARLARHKPPDIP